MTAIVPFDFAAPVPGATRRPNSINQEAVIASAALPTISIKGKTFAIVRDGERKVLTRVIDDETVPVSSLSMVVVRANAKARVFFGRAYVEDAAEVAKPMCFSYDGVLPDANAATPQSKNCALCPNSQWGSKVSQDGQAGKGTACTVNTRLAVADPGAPEKVYLLRVPAGSRVAFSEAVKVADSHGKDYNEVGMRISFDQEQPSPHLLFQPKGLLTDAAYAKVQALYDSAAVQDIVGMPSIPSAEVVGRPALAAPAVRATPALAVSESDIEDALETPPAPAPAPVRRAQAKPPAAAPAPPPAAATSDGSALLGELESLLGAHDD